ncbi:hypothetical protein [Streptomyces sp. NBC_00316]|uniref:hypothetical protein n=1 Tax=Streptomyces sp. NBC_00316 TaxID=2975710 RepID=UPI002E29CF38|nr:hypothetical protein [Streptomyces sp. NBC_00316]
MRRLRALGVLLPFVLLAAGCGIQSTDVVEVGDPATAEVVPGRNQGTLLYFISPSARDGVLPVVRVAGRPEESASSGTGDAKQRPVELLALLFNGPSPAERKAGLRTELPMLSGEMSLDVDPDRVRVRLPSPVTKLSGLARRQLICTLAHAPGTEPGADVMVSGTDGSVGPDRCSV